MRSPLRTSVVSAVAVVLSVVVMSPAAIAGSTARSFPVQTRVHQHQYSHAQATRIFRRLHEALTPKHAAPRMLGDPLPRRDLSLLLRQAQDARGSMTARQQSIVDEYGRPVPEEAGCNYNVQNTFDPTNNDLPITRYWSVSNSLHFCVHYQTSGAAAATPAQVTATKATLEHVYDTEVAGLGFKAPLPDSDHLIDVFLDQLGAEGYYGFCARDNGSSPTSTAWCGLDNDFSVSEFGAPPINSLEVTVAHEFFHAIQFGYNAHRENWLMEGTAVWMEDQVYPSINDYLQYVRQGGAIVNPRTPIDTDAQSQWYAATLFWKFLSESRHDPSIVKQVWNLASTYVTRTALQDVVSALAERRLSFRSEFGLFGVWNTLPPRTYVDRSLYPAPAYWARVHLTRSRPDTGWVTVFLNHLTNASMIIRPGAAMPRRARVRLSVNAPPSPLGWATVQVRLHNGRVFIYNIALNGQGDGSKVVTFNPRQVSSVILIATNASTHNSNGRKFLVRARALT